MAEQLGKGLRREYSERRDSPNFVLHELVRELDAGLEVEVELVGPNEDLRRERADRVQRAVAHLVGVLDERGALSDRSGDAHTAESREGSQCRRQHGWWMTR